MYFCRSIISKVILTSSMLRLMGTVVFGTIRINRIFFFPPEIKLKYLEVTIKTFGHPFPPLNSHNCITITQFSHGYYFLQSHND